MTSVFDDEFARNEAEKRVALLKRYYNLYCYTDKATGDTMFAFVRAGAPHYYMTDIYGTELIFKNAEGDILQKAVGYGIEEESSVIKGKLPKGTNSVEWLITDAGFALDMGELTVKELELRIPNAIPADRKAGNDGMLDQQRLLICADTSDKPYANLVYTFAQTLTCKETDIYAIEIDNTSGQKLTAKIVLYQNDKAIERYLKPILPGGNLIVFSTIGCVDQGKANLTSIDKINLQIYTSTLAEDVILEVGELYRFEQPLQLVQYLETSEYRINFGQG